MPRTIKTEVYTFDELKTEKAKDKAREWYRAGIDYGWWESVYEDAEQIGLKITGFDFDHCHVNATGELTEPMDQVIHLIQKEHGKDCDTYTLAEEFIEKRAIKLTKKEDEDEDDYEDRLEEAQEQLEAEFEQRLVEEYGSNLQKEWEYLNSDEQVDESILANEYTFTKDGKRFG